MRHVAEAILYCQAWKAGAAPMKDMVPAFKKSPAQEDLPKEVKVPELLLCKHADGRLTIPREIRSEFLGCPIHGPEWRELLVKFDKEWSPSSLGEASVQQTATNKTEAAAESQPAAAASLVAGQSFFPNGRCSTMPSGVLHQFPGPVSSVKFAITEGPGLWMIANEAYTWKKDAMPLITHGAGVWLVDEKAKAAKDDKKSAPRVISCEFPNDEAPVILEATRLTCSILRRLLEL